MVPMAGGNVRRDKCMLMVTLRLNVQHTHHPLCGIVAAMSKTQETQ